VMLELQRLLPHEVHSVAAAHWHLYAIGTGETETRDAWACQQRRARRIEGNSEWHRILREQDELAVSSTC